MDNLKDYELKLLIDNLQWATHQSMEETRLLMYSVSAPYMKVKKNIKNFFPLPTDETHKSDEKPLEGEELERVRNMIKSAFNKKGNEEKG